MRPRSARPPWPCCGGSARLRTAPLDGRDGRSHARIVCRQETDQRQQQQAGVDSLASHSDCVNVPSPSFQPSRHTSSWMSAAAPLTRSIVAAARPLPSCSAETVQAHPGHHLRIGVVPALRARLPYAGASVCHTFSRCSTIARARPSPASARPLRRGARRPARRAPRRRRRSGAGSMRRCRSAPGRRSGSPAGRRPSTPTDAGSRRPGT